MKKLLIFSILLFSLFISSAQEKTAITKKGWNFGALPTITFDTDLGFQYGALVNLYDYGDGTRFPKYNHSLYFEVSRFTKGSGINRFYYDSDDLIKGLQTSFDLSYLSDQAYDFYGFNGYNAVYQPDWIDDAKTAPLYKTRMYYKYDRKLFRAKIDIQGKLSGDHFRWLGGINLQNFKISDINLDKLNKGKEGSEVLPDTVGLFGRYKNWGIISGDEVNGGFVPTIKAGIVFDTRDTRSNPMKGMWTEAVIEAAPKFLGAESSFSKFSLIHRQYFTLVPQNLSLVYRLAYQSTLGGKVPFYYQSQVITSVLTGYLSEGLGGSKTIRGILRNRVVGDGFFYGNVEARWKFVRFTFIKNNWYLGLNGFTDFGRVTKKIKIPDSIIQKNPSFFKVDAEKFHTSAGAGLRIVMNENFVISVDYGKALNKQDGTSGMYIGLNYLF
jgi:hypothetical protein